MKIFFERVRNISYCILGIYVHKMINDISQNKKYKIHVQCMEIRSITGSDFFNC